MRHFLSCARRGLLPGFLAPALLAVVAAGGYLQIAGQDAFYCGRVEAYPGLYILAGLTLAHTALYLAATARPGWRRLYRLSQWAVLPAVVFSLSQVVEPHLGTFCLMAGLVAAAAWMGLFRTGLFLALLFGMFAALGQIPFSVPGVTVPTWLVWVTFAAAAGVAASWSRSPALPQPSRRGPSCAARGRLGDVNGAPLSQPSRRGPPCAARGGLGDVNGDPLSQPSRRGPSCAARGGLGDVNDTPLPQPSRRGPPCAARGRLGDVNGDPLSQPSRHGPPCADHPEPMGPPGSGAVVEDGPHKAGHDGDWVAGRDGDWVADRDGDCVAGLDGDCAAGPDGDWVTGLDGDWVAGRDGDWVAGRDGDWVAGRDGDCAAGRDGDCAVGCDSGFAPFQGLVRLIPLSLLLFPVLRAHLPDAAYDSLSYKVTIPYQMAEWRTGGMAIIDGYMVGTNLQEMLNTLLLVLTGDWLPSFISTLGFVLLILVIPRAFPAETGRSGGERAVIAFAGVAAFVLTEAQIAQGTSYQEPLLLLFLAAALIRHPAWLGFLGMAVAVKITAMFAAPLIVVYQMLVNRGFWRSPRRLLAGVLVAALALAPQLGRNVVFSGRLLGMNETLARVTDPPGPHQVMAGGSMIYDRHPRGGLLNNAVGAACNIWLLDGLCPVRYQGSFEAGFGHFPSSRAPLFALVLGVAACVAWRRREAWLGLGAFLVGAVGLLGVLSEGRYLLPLSLGFPILLMLNACWVAPFARRPAMLLLACWLIGGELVPGTFANTSWICRRDIAAPVQNPPLRGPASPVQSFLASLTDRYKKTCPPPGLPPVILAENDRLNSPYLGTQRIFHVFSQILIERFLQANPVRQGRMADAVIAVVSEHPGYAPHVLGSSRADFVSCYDGEGLHVLCSARLAPAGPDCAHSLY